MLYCGRTHTQSVSTTHTHTHYQLLFIIWYVMGSPIELRCALCKSSTIWPCVRCVRLNMCGACVCVHQCQSDNRNIVQFPKRFTRTVNHLPGVNATAQCVCCVLYRFGWYVRSFDVASLWPLLPEKRARVYHVCVWFSGYSNAVFVNDRIYQCVSTFCNFIWSHHTQTLENIQPLNAKTYGSCSLSLSLWPLLSHTSSTIISYRKIAKAKVKRSRLCCQHKMCIQQIVYMNKQQIQKTYAFKKVQLSCEQNQFQMHTQIN